MLPDRVMREGTPADRAAIYADLARVLAALHGVDWRAAGLSEFGRAERYMERQVARWTGQWNRPSGWEVAMTPYAMRENSAKAATALTSTLR